MKPFIFLMLFGLLNSADAQKPVVDSGIYGKWPKITSWTLSNDGDYSAYYVKDGTNSFSFIKALHSNYQVKLPYAGVNFSPDSKRAVYKTGKDSLAMLVLATSEVRFILNVKTYTFLESAGSSWLIYLKNTPDNEFVAENLQTGALNLFKDVLGYNIRANPSGDSKRFPSVLLRVKTDMGMTALRWLDLSTGHLIEIWTGRQPGEFIFSKNSGAVAFKAISADSTRRLLYWYKSGMTRAEVLLSSDDGGLGNKISALSVIGFNQDCTKLFVRVQEDPLKLPESANAAKVDVWSYFDPKLQSLQLMEANIPGLYTCVIHTADHKIIELGTKGDELLSANIEGRADYVLVQNSGAGDLAEADWNRTAKINIYLISAVDGSRKLIDSVHSKIRACFLSPDEKYIVYHNPLQKNYFSYEIATGKRCNITRGISTAWTSYERNDETLSVKWSAYGIAGWTLQDTAVLIYDQNDIIKADLKGNKQAINLTHGYGRKHSIRFQRMFNNDYFNPAPVDENRSLLLTAFNRETKDAGFFNLNFGNKGGVEKLVMSPCNFALVKARDSNAYLVMKERADRFPNLFYSDDLKEFKAITDLQPEDSINWISNELITWTQLDGQKTQGILYKPKDFDPTKKYPLIFFYYERLTDQMHRFLFPGLIHPGAIIDVPTYVSNGYLVLCADIHFSIGNPGGSAYNSVVAAAKAMSKFPWVDLKRMGLNGHSYGGYMTNYIITHSHLFAAAVSACGWSNFTSSSNRIRQNGSHAMDYYEIGKQRMGGNLWERTANYIAASPVFKAADVTTPVLLMNNKADEDVDFYEGVQFFTALRRLGKKAWMLQYDGEGHELSNRINITDFMIREKQFFDHYLKGTPAPKWMVSGIPASKKGIEPGYQLEPTGMEPGPNLLKASNEIAE